MKTGQRKLPTTVKHVLQVRLSKDTVADIDSVIATVPQLDGFSRSRFVRAAVRYALDSLAEDGYLRGGRSAAGPKAPKRTANKKARRQTNR
jgi:Arc/MetJ-type ribon-helix-helix transcriptional regulator